MYVQQKRLLWSNRIESNFYCGQLSMNFFLVYDDDYSWTDAEGQTPMIAYSYGIIAFNFKFSSQSYILLFSDK